jgi:hypothetical protein
MPPSLTPPDAEWATKPYSYIAPHREGPEWAAWTLMGGQWGLWHIGPKEIALREAKKQGNRLKRLEASSAPVHKR